MVSSAAPLRLNPAKRADLAAVAADTIAKGSKSFAAAAKLFDPETRRSATMLYAWCRHCDDVVDDQELGFRRGTGAAGTSPADRLRELREQTAAALRGQPGGEPAFRALAEVASRHAMPHRLAFEHLDGYGMDVNGRAYHTIADTLDYCYGVAGVVGVMMGIVMGARDEEVLDRACDLGLAFQLTNIARDIVEDAGTGRVYLPADWLEEAGLRAGDIADSRFRPQVARLAARLVDLAEPYYASALVGLSALPLRSAWAVATAHGVYREIGVEVKALGPAAWDARVSTGRRRKLAHVARGANLALASRRFDPAPRDPALWTRPR